MLNGYELPVIALIGIILLIGIVQKNGIMMIDFALTADRSHGLPPKEAIYQACLLRLRPLMLPTSCALLSRLPLRLRRRRAPALSHPPGFPQAGRPSLSPAPP